MRYKIEINLLALSEMKSKISLEEAVLLDYLYWLCSSPSEEVDNMRIEKDGRKYTWFDYGYYIQETPILRGKTKATLTPKIKSLEQEGFIETISNDGFRKYVRLLPKCDLLFRKLNATVKKTKRLPFRKLNIDNNTINNNTMIRENNTPADEMRLFIESGEYLNNILKMMVDRGAPEQITKDELLKFRSYWMELNKTGTKRRWEMEKTFELYRRLGTWFRNVNQFNQRLGPKGKTIFNTLQ